MAPRSTDLPTLLEVTLGRRAGLRPDRALLVGISGIDGSGKGWVTTRIGAALEHAGHRVASLNVDGWLNLPSVRFSPDDPAGHFYRHALRLPELVSRLLQPLRTTRAVDLVADHAEETAVAFRPHRYDFADIDVILAEGIFLFKREYRPLFDLAVWIDCSWSTALERALARCQEGLPPAQTVKAYRTIYFPAQELHFSRDRPREHADLILVNDERLAA